MAPTELDAAADELAALLTRDTLVRASLDDAGFNSSCIPPSHDARDTALKALRHPHLDPATLRALREALKSRYPFASLDCLERLIQTRTGRGQGPTPTQPLSPGSVDLALQRYRNYAARLIPRLWSGPGARQLTTDGLGPSLRASFLGRFSLAGDGQRLQNGLDDIRFLLFDRRRLLIEGVAGVGKSTASALLFQSFLQDDHCFPLLLPGGHLSAYWRATEDRGDQPWLATYCGERISAMTEGNQGRGLPRDNLFTRLLSHPPLERTILLLDGIDELGDAADGALIQVENLLREHPGLRVVLTSRPCGNGWTISWDPEEQLQLRKLDREEIGEVVHQHLESQLADRDVEPLTRAFLRSIATDEAWELASIPLLLTMMLEMSLPFILSRRDIPTQPTEPNGLYRRCLLHQLENVRDPDSRAVSSHRPLGDAEVLNTLSRAVWRVCEEVAAQGRPLPTSFAAFELRGALQTESRPGRGLSSPTARRDQWHFMKLLLGAGVIQTQRQLGTADTATSLTVDDQLEFPHLTYRDFLAANGLALQHPTLQSRLAALTEKLHLATLWPILAVTTSIPDGDGKDLARELIAHLLPSTEESLALQTPAGQQRVWFAGLLLAGGMGTPEHFARWLDLAFAILSRRWSAGSDLCLGAWVRSAHSDRVRQLRAELEHRSQGVNWLTWLRLEGFAAEAGVDVELRPLPAGSAGAAALNALHHAAASDGEIAAGRVHFGCGRGWPGDHLHLLYLQLWPGLRRSLGVRLQLAANFGATRDDLLRIGGLLLRQPTWTSALNERIRSLADALYSGWQQDAAGDLYQRLRESAFMADLGRAGVQNPHWLSDEIIAEVCMDVARDLARYYVRFSGQLGSPEAIDDQVRHARTLCHYLSENMWPSVERHLSGLLLRAVSTTLLTELTDDEARPGVQVAVRHARSLARVFISELKRTPENDASPPAFARTLLKSWRSAWADRDPPHWLEEFARVDLRSITLSSPRMIGVQLTAGLEDPVARLMQEACRLSLTPRRDRGDLANALGRVDDARQPGALLWRALASHLVGDLPPAKRRWLESLSMDPASAIKDLPGLPRLVISGLRYIVRGDVRLDDGEILSLDDLTAHMDLPPLPHLGELPEVRPLTGAAPATRPTRVAGPAPVQVEVEVAAPTLSTAARSTQHSTLDDEAIIDQLKALLPSQLEEVIARLKVDASHLKVETQLQRSLDLLRLMKGVARLRELVEMVSKVQAASIRSPTPHTSSRSVPPPGSNDSLP